MSESILVLQVFDTSGDHVREEEGEADAHVVRDVSQHAFGAHELPEERRILSFEPGLV